MAPNSITDLRNYIDGLWGDLSEAEYGRIADQLQHEAHVDGLSYPGGLGNTDPDVWAAWLESATEADRVLGWLSGDRETITDDIPETDDTTSLHALIDYVGERTPEGIDIRGSRARLVLYWDRQDSSNQGWAWALHSGRDDSGRYGVDDVTSGSLDSLGEAIDLLGLTEDLRAVECDDAWCVRDDCHVWWPDNETAREIVVASDPARRAIMICMTAPSCGVWHD